jgi:hypothetical protein
MDGGLISWSDEDGRGDSELLSQAADLSNGRDRCLGGVQGMRINLLLRRWLLTGAWHAY